MKGSHLNQRLIFTVPTDLAVRESR